MTKKRGSGRAIEVESRLTTQSRQTTALNALAPFTILNQRQAQKGIAPKPSSANLPDPHVYTFAHPSPLPVRTPHAARTFRHIHQAGRWDGLFAPAAKTEFGALHLAEGQVKARQLAAGGTQGGFGYAFVVDRIHAADAADGIFRGDGLGILFQAFHLILHCGDRFYNFLPEYLPFLFGHG